MAEWRVGRSTGRTLWRDDVLVGMVDSPEIAQDIVAAMRVVGRLLAEQPEAVRERSQDAWQCPAETWSWWHFTDQQVDAYWIRCTLLGRHEEHEDENTGLCWRTGERPSGDVIRESRITALDPSRVDPYDTTKGFTE